MDGPTRRYTKWDKSERKKILNDLTSVWDLKNPTKLRGKDIRFVVTRGVGRGNWRKVVKIYRPALTGPRDVMYNMATTANKVVERVDPKSCHHKENFFSFYCVVIISNIHKPNRHTVCFKLTYSDIWQLFLNKTGKKTFFFWGRRIDVRALVIRSSSLS